MLAPGASFAVDTLVALGLLSARDTSFALEALVEREILVKQKAIVGKREALPREAGEGEDGGRKMVVGR